MPKLLSYDLERPPVVRCVRCGYFHAGKTEICEACIHRGVSFPPTTQEKGIAMGEHLFKEIPLAATSMPTLPDGTPSAPPCPDEAQEDDALPMNDPPLDISRGTSTPPTTPTCRVCCHASLSEINEALRADTVSFTTMAHTFRLPRQVFSLHRTHCLGLPKHTKMSALLKGRTLAAHDHPPQPKSPAVISFLDAVQAECLRLTTAMTQATTEVETLQALIASAQARFRQAADQLQALQHYRRVAEGDTPASLQTKDD